MKFDRKVAKHCFATFLFSPGVVIPLTMSFIERGMNASSKTGSDMSFADDRITGN
jgi:hypothetical protein